MTKKADFNADEWSTVVEGPLLAGVHVVAASRGGTIRESLAMGKVYTEARRQQGESELLDELVASPPALDPQRLQGEGDVGAATAAGLRQAIGVVREKAAPEDVEAYKRFVLDVARGAAEAHKEGGFVGIGGKQVSDEEQAALDEISATLEGDGAPPADGP